MILLLYDLLVVPMCTSYIVHIFNHFQVSTDMDTVCFGPSAFSIARSVPANEVADEVNRLSRNSVNFQCANKFWEVYTWTKSYYC